jgi:outer membrane protein TolC
MIIAKTIGLAVALQGAPAKLTLQEAIALAEANAFAVRSAQSTVEKNRQLNRQFWGNLGPQVAVTGQHLRYAEAQPGFGGGSGPDRSSFAGASLSFPLDVTGVVRTAIRAQEFNTKASEEELRAVRNDLRLAVKNAYFDVLLAEGGVAVAEAALSAAKEQERVTTAAKEAGTAAHVDVLRVQTDVRRAENALLAARNRVVLAKANLNNVLARPMSSPIDVEDLPLAEPVTVSEEVAQEAAMRNRPELESIRNAQKALKSATKAQQGGLLPNLSVALSYQHAFEPRNPFTNADTTTASLNLSWPIFDSGITRAKIRQAREDERQAQIRLEQTQLTISLQVRQAVQNLATAADRLGVARKQVETAEETLRLSELRDRAGEGLLLEVLDAQRQLTQARNDLNTAKYDYLAALAALQRAIGRDDVDAALQAKS